VWVSNGRFGFFYSINGGGAARCRTPHLDISIFNELEQKHPSLPLVLKLAPLHCL
jgi:hypothetical protein